MKLNHGRPFLDLVSGAKMRGWRHGLCIIIHYYKCNRQHLSESYLTIKRIGGYVPSILFLFHFLLHITDITGNAQHQRRKQNLWRKIF